MRGNQLDHFSSGADFILYLQENSLNKLVSLSLPVSYNERVTVEHHTLLESDTRTRGTRDHDADSLDSRTLKGNVVCLGVKRAVIADRSQSKAFIEIGARQRLARMNMGDRGSGCYIRAANGSIR